MKNLIIIGVGGFARETHFHAENSVGYQTEFTLKGFLDGDVKLPEEEYKKLRLPLLGDVNNYEIQKDDVFVCTVADPKVREKLVGIVEKKGGEFFTLIHRTALISSSSKIGVGSILSAFVVIQPDCVVGNHAIFNVRSSTGHDTQVGNFCSFMGVAGTSGNTKVGNRVYMSTGASTMPYAVIEEDVYVGWGSVVFKRAKAGQKVFGCPAMPI